MTAPRVHGGTDALGVPRHDFSTNSNAWGPCPAALAAVQHADARHYPDAAYTDLRTSLAAFHGVAVARVLLAGSASEFIFRISAWVARGALGAGAVASMQQLAPNMPPAVHLPPHAYGDYAQAALAWGLPQAAHSADAALVWACEPSSPLGQAHCDWPASVSEVLCPTTAQGLDGTAAATHATRPICVLDSAYLPLRLSGAPSLNAAQLDQVWRLFTPNKALGLTGVRAAYVIAPCAMKTGTTGRIYTVLSALNQLAPSWVVGAHGVAMLQAWVSPAVQAWLADALPVLRGWKTQQIAMLQALGWQVQTSEANYFCARPPHALDLAALRARHGIKLRDCASFGLPGWFRLGVLPPQAQDALSLALQIERASVQ